MSKSNSNGKRIRGSLALAIVAGVALVGCPPSILPQDGLELPGTGDAFGGVQCSAVRPQSEPDLMGWDPSSRANLNRLRHSGIVAVRYEAKGCNVELELLSNCIVKGRYDYAPYAAEQRKIAHNEAELFAELPIGAAKLAAKVKGNRVLRTDYMLAGVLSLPPSADYHVDELDGRGCDRATHVVSAIYLGGFAMAAGEGRELEASASIFSAGVGVGTAASAERLDREGDPAACKEAQKSGEEVRQCTVPLRIGLLPLDGVEVAGATTAASQPKTEPGSSPIVVPDKPKDDPPPPVSSDANSCRAKRKSTVCRRTNDCCSDEYCYDPCASGAANRGNLLGQDSVDCSDPDRRWCRRKR